MKNTKNTTAFKTYISEIKTHFADGDATEHTYRPALEAYIRSFGNFRVTNEPGQRGHQKGRSRNKPDFVVSKGKAPLGYIETKDINVDLDDASSSDQIERYCAAYPNLILTDYVEFRRYVKGELRSKIKIGQATKNGLSISTKAQDELNEFFEEFLVEETFSISNSAELADRLATLTRQIKKFVKQELSIEEDSANLHKLMTAFKKVLMADLNEDKFADMFAQTLTYGFFAARIHFDGKGEFSRRTASTILPKTNPFLRKLFREFADENLPDRLIGAVDEIIDVLKKTDVEKILLEFGEQGKNDAVVHFYESFLGAYDANLKKEMGVFYTPDPVVEYMVKSLDEILEQKFDRKKGLADDKTLILDPALGTGSFLHKIVDNIHERVQKGSWDSYVSENLLDRIFGFEILMAPYAVAHLNLGMQLQKSGYSFGKDQRLGVYLTNTLEETAKRSEVLFADWISDEANAAAAVKRDKAIMVVTGNPPYSADSQNDGEWIRDLMRGYDNLNHKNCANYFECEGQPLGERNPKSLNDDYVKFMRFAHWRIEQTGHGLLAFITNHGYLENPIFRGMREALTKDFDEIYIFDLHGNSKRKEKSPDGSKDENVFDIQQGVSICFMLRENMGDKKANRSAKVYRADLYGTRESKYNWLSNNSFNSTKFERVYPESPFFLYSKQNKKALAEYNNGISVTEIFGTHGVGMTTARDAFIIDSDEKKLLERVKKFKSFQGSNRELCEELDIAMKTGWNIDSSRKALAKEKDLSSFVQKVLYRPFDERNIFYHDSLVWRTARRVMEPMIHTRNIALVTARSNKSGNPNHFFVSESPTEAKAGESTTQSALFPLYVIDEKGKKISNLRADILEWAEGFSNQNPEMQCFEYIYAMVHAPSYRERYKEFLKGDFPRIHLTEDKKLFLKMSKLGRELISYHLLKSDILDGGKSQFGQKGSNVIEKVKFDISKQRVYINDEQFFDHVDSNSWNIEFGGYQILEKWLKDRKGEKLGHKEIVQYERIVEAIKRTSQVMANIDLALDEAGGIPLAKEQARKKAA